MPTYNWRVNSSYTIPTAFDIRSTVDILSTESLVSPIDQFISKNQELNTLLVDPNNFRDKLTTLNTNGKLSNKALIECTTSLLVSTNINPVLANLILLGHVSAVESYFRAIFRRLILIDPQTQKKCQEKMLSYGAVLVHDKISLPDALLDLINFASKKNIEDSLRDFFGVTGKFPSGLPDILFEFGKICQLRHSIVHKFGVLGANNVRHDLSGHSQYVNKSIKNSFATIQDVSLICTNVVKEVNQLLWQNTMMRLIADNDNGRWKKKTVTIWKFSWSKDRHKFMKYFEIFFSNTAPPPSADPKTAYSDLISTYSSL